NNPTGTSISEDDIYQIASTHRGPIIIDEAYIDFSNKKSSLKFLCKNDNIIILRTFSKAWGRPDLRLGSIISSQKWIDRLVKMQPPFQVSKYAILEFEKMLENQDSIKDNIDKVIKERDKLLLMLSDLSQLKIYKSDANFIYCKCKSYADLKDHLINNKIQVKCFDRMYPETMRITVSSNENNTLLAQALHEFYN
ncbi:aminotransferase class I/II-fold pyridoxal phosphate-dependent enzyme, partial [Vibrio coralliilyticus]